MRVACVIPARNESLTVGAVVGSAVASGVCDEVIVVSDGSTDGTAAIARSAGASQVIEREQSEGKGAALAAGVAATDADTLCFLDADLLGLTVEHVRDLVRPVVAGEVAMRVGVRGTRSAIWRWWRRQCLVSGQRTLRRAVFEAVPNQWGGGYGIEKALQLSCKTRGWSVDVTELMGLRTISHFRKAGVGAGLIHFLKMGLEILHVVWGFRWRRQINRTDRH